MRYLLLDAALALRPVWKGIFVTALVLCLPWPLPALGLRIKAPPDLTAPNPASIRVAGAPPKSMVRIETIRRVSEEWSFVGAAQFVADSDGQVDTRSAKPESGAYSGVDALGLFWSVASRRAQSSDPVPGEVRVSAQVDGGGAVSAVARTAPDNALLLADTNTPFAGGGRQDCVDPCARPSLGGYL